MHNQLETYLEQLAQSLQSLPEEQREAEVREARHHLESLVAQGLADGQSPDEAMRSAIHQFGSPTANGKDLQWAWQRAKRQQESNSAENNLMKNFLISMSRVFVPVGIAAFTLAFFALFFVRQPSTTSSNTSAWNDSFIYENTRHQAEVNAIQTRFHAGARAIQQMQQKNPGNSRLVQQAMEANGKRFSAEMDACNLRWMQNMQRLQRNVLTTTLVVGTAYLMLFLSLCAFTAKFFSRRFKRQYT